MTKTEMIEMLINDYGISEKRLWRYAASWFSTEQLMEMLVYFCEDLEIDLPQELFDKYC